MQGFWLSVDLPEHMVNQQEESRNIGGGGSNGKNGRPADPHQQMLAITESLKAFASSIEAISYSAFQADNEKNKVKSALSSPSAGSADEEAVLLLSKEYLGVAKGSMVSTHKQSPGYTMYWWNSLQLTITSVDPNTSEVIAKVTETNLRKLAVSPDGQEVNGNDLQGDHPLYKWGKDLVVRVSDFKGVYKSNEVLLTGAAERISEEANGVQKSNFNEKKYTYHWVLRPGELVGVQIGTNATTSTILKQIV
jgi:hypothetical protein